MIYTDFGAKRNFNFSLILILLLSGCSTADSIFFNQLQSSLKYNRGTKPDISKQFLLSMKNAGFHNSCIYHLYTKKHKCISFETI